MPDELIKGAIATVAEEKQDVEGAVEENKEQQEGMFTTIYLATKRGIRKHKVKTKHLKTHYKATRKKGPGKVYARAIPVYNKLENKVERKAVIDKSEYIYSPFNKAYVRYDPDELIEVPIGPSDERTKVRAEELRYLWEKQGAYYKEVRTSAREYADEPPEKHVVQDPGTGQQKIAMPRSSQIAVKRVTYIAGVRYVLTGYSRVTYGTMSEEEMIEQAKRHIMAQIVDIKNGEYDFSDVEYSDPPEIEYIRWVKGTWNRA